MMIQSVGRQRRKAVWSATRWLRATCAACIATAGALSAAPVFAQSTPIESARALYVAAAYDDALTLLNDLRAPDRGEDIGRIEYYRALCLLAVGREADADAAIEAAVTAAPFVQPSDADASPRVRSAFREVRRRVLPSIINHKYADAKTAFEKKDISAAERFREVIALIDEPDTRSLDDQPRFSQLRALAADYLTLSIERQSMH
jgi:tetratricopeptide (TPR) repeat protein